MNENEPKNPLETEAETEVEAKVDFDSAPEDDMADIDAATEAEIDPEHVRLLEAVLFASSDPVAERSLARRLPEGVNVKALLKVLRGLYEGRGVILVRCGGSWGFRTAPDLGSRLNIEVEVQRKLSRAAIETLAIIAYHQPVTRAEIEEIRGVSLSKGTLDVLFGEGWIKPRGHRDTPGRPMMWGTTDGFLDHFALESVRDLPGMKDLRAMGLLDARPAIEAYTVRGDMQTSEEVQETLQLEDGEIVPPEYFADADVSGETGPEHGNLPEPDSQEEAEPRGRGGESQVTAHLLDEAMANVAVAVKSAVKALEPDEDDGEAPETVPEGENEENIR